MLGKTESEARSFDELHVRAETGLGAEAGGQRKATTPKPAATGNG